MRHREENYILRLPSGVSQVLQLVKIIGGNLSSAVQMIQYLADPISVTTFYDPDVDTVYQNGLGNAWLLQDGEQISRVLVRHNFAGMPDAVMAGVTYLAAGPIPLTIATTAAPPGSPVTGQRYTVGSSPSGAWSGHAGETATWNGAAWVFSAAPSSSPMVAYTLARG